MVIMSRSCVRFCSCCCVMRVVKFWRAMQNSTTGFVAVAEWQKLISTFAFKRQRIPSQKVTWFWNGICGNNLSSKLDESPNENVALKHVQQIGVELKSFGAGYSSHCGSPTNHGVGAWALKSNLGAGGREIILMFCRRLVGSSVC